MATSQDDPIHILFIGETGVGKTSLVNLFHSYAKQKNDKEEYVDIKNIEQCIVARKRCDSMTSDTEVASTYSFKMKEVEIVAIDTPGLVDSRGEEQSRGNVRKIISKVQSFDYLNCICLVFNGTVSRFTYLIEFVIKEILKLLPSDVLSHVIVVFTKTSDALSLNFNLESLNKYGLDIPAEYSFMLENPFCRWEKAKKIGILGEESAELKKAFTNTFKTLDKMVATARKFEPIAAKKFGELHTIISKLEEDITYLRLAVLCQVRLEGKIAELKLHLKTQEGYKTLESEYDSAEQLTVVPTPDESNVVCLTCSENCHLNCRCLFTGKFFGSIRMCQNFKRGSCNGCAHPSAIHVKQKFRFDKVKLRTTADEENSETNIERLIQKQKEKLEEDEKNLIRESKKVEEHTTKLLQNLRDFQRIGSNSFLIKVTEKEIERLKRLLKEIPKFKEEENVTKIFNDTIEIGKNPFSTKDSLKEVQIIWACGMLGVNRENITQDEIDTKFRKFHITEQGRTAQTLEQYKYYEHAKAILVKSLS